MKMLGGGDIGRLNTATQILGTDSFAALRGNGLVRHAVSKLSSYYSFTKVMADYAISETDGVILADASTGEISITLPTGDSYVGRSFTIKKTNNSGSDVTVVGLIDGSSNATLTGNNYPSVTVLYDGTEWWIL